MGRLPGLHSLGLPSSRSVFVLRVSGILVRLAGDPPDAREHPWKYRQIREGPPKSSEAAPRREPDIPADVKRRTKTRLCF